MRRTGAVPCFGPPEVLAAEGPVPGAWLRVAQPESAPSAVTATTATAAVRPVSPLELVAGRLSSAVGLGRNTLMRVFPSGKSRWIL
jgi:hypothetical protein